jgi:hypothetical protein
MSIIITLFYTSLAFCISFAIVFLTLLFFNLSEKFNWGIIDLLERLDDYIESLAEKIYKRFKK